MQAGLRAYVTPLVCAFVSEGLLILVLRESGGAAAPASLLFLVEAAILGFVFGPAAGAIAAVAPVVTFGVIDTLNGSATGEEFGLVVFLVLLLGFTAWFVGVLRRRFGRP